MPILSLDAYVAAPKQLVPFDKTGARTMVAHAPFSVFDVAGNPGAGTLAVGNTANGIVPVAGQAGYPAINAFGAGNDGHIARADYSNTVAGRIFLYDRLFKAGAYAFNANVTLASQPSYAGRVLDFRGLQIWVETVTAATGNQAVNVFYTNQDGVTGRQTGAVGIGAAPTVGRCWQLPLQAGDSGVQRIEQVIGSVASAGTFNVMVLRKVWFEAVHVAGLGVVHDMLRTGLVRVWATSAFYQLITVATGTALGTPQMTFEVANG